MTTNVFDSNAGLMTTDSRWSVEYGRYLIYIDDVPFEKIEIYERVAFMFAGNGQRIQEWKDWIRSRPTGLEGKPSCEKMCVCIANLESSQVLFEDRQDIIKDGGYFAGSGSIHAFRCWSTNRDAVRAVETAKGLDYSSGGVVKFLKFGTREQNLFSPSRDMRIEDVTRALSERGEVMEVTVNKTDGPPFKLSELAANDPALKDVQAKIAGGEIAPAAPCDGMYSEWTPAQTSKLNGVLGDIFGWQK